MEVTPPNYAILRKDRETRGGGVALLISKKLNFTPLPHVEGVEAIFCKLLLSCYSIIVGCVYRSPAADTDTMLLLYKYMHNHLRQGRVILLGDFNLPDINWLTMAHHSAHSDVILDIMLDFNLHQAVNTPTRNHGFGGNILDLIFLSSHFPLEEIKIEVTDGISDHKMVMCSIPVNNKGSKSVLKSFPDFHNADDTSIIDHLSHELSSFTEISCQASTDIEILWHTFKDIVSHCIQKFVPLKAKKIKKHNPWITRDVIHAKRKVKRLRKSLKKKFTTSTKNNLDDAIIRLKVTLKAARENFFSHKLNNFIKTSPTKFWNYLNPKSSDEKTASPSESLATANALNNYFQSVFTRDDSSTPHMEACAKRHIEPITITESGILNLLLNLDAKKGSGPDNIPNTFLKKYAEWVAKYLCLIFDKSLTTGRLPKEWKTARITPVHKSGNRHDPANFRPISITCAASKILEHVILKHITSFLDAESILTPFQHGFRRGLSTVTQLLELVHDLSLGIDSRKQIDLILLDFSKAFDRVTHQKLIYKLKLTLGNGPIINWITDYLRDRLQFVEIDGQSSDTAQVISGVPQGCVLAPVLFFNIHQRPTR